MVKFSYLIFLFFSLFSSLFAAKIGVVVMATGKYVQFVPPLVDSAKKYFCKNHEVTFFVFTDGQLQHREGVVVFYQEKLGWPLDTMMRSEVYLKQEKILKAQDYLYAMDADMLFSGDIGDEILGDRVGTQHPGFIGRRGTYETNPLSAAYVSCKEGETYYCGGFYGGRSGEFLALSRAIVTMVGKDQERGIIPVWHDESCLNRYFIDHKPDVTLPCTYCVPEECKNVFEEVFGSLKIIALLKNHQQLRGEECELWWEKCLGRAVSYETFQGWVGDEDAPSRIVMRDHVKKKGYSSLLDVAAGLGTDYKGIVRDKMGIKYVGVEISPRLVDMAEKQNIPMRLGSIQSLPFLPNSFDIAYARHILENLPSYDAAISELIRVAKKEVLIVFFIKPGETSIIHPSIESGNLLYHNMYNKRELENRARAAPKVASLEWQEVNAKEVILHLYLREARDHSDASQCQQ